jgi:cell division protein FtsQ
MGHLMADINCHAIEQCLQRHDMVREVECYKSLFGCVNIVVAQRVPKLQVVANDGCYYVDSDRRVMPVRGEMSGVPVFSGAVSERAARDEYFDFAKWLEGNDFWSARIHRIQVNTPRNIILNQEGQTSKIILGGIDGYEAKLQKLRKLYTKGFDKIGYPECREYDLRFTNQVVCRK